MNGLQALEIVWKNSTDGSITSDEYNAIKKELEAFEVVKKYCSVWTDYDKVDKENDYCIETDIYFNEKEAKKLKDAGVIDGR